MFNKIWRKKIKLKDFGIKFTLKEKVSQPFLYWVYEEMEWASFPFLFVSSFTNDKNLTLSRKSYSMINHKNGCHDILGCVMNSKLAHGKTTNFSARSFEFTTCLEEVKLTPFQ